MRSCLQHESDVPVATARERVPPQRRSPLITLSPTRKFHIQKTDIANLTHNTKMRPHMIWTSGNG